MLYLSDASIDRLGVPAARLRGALTRAFRLHADGKLQVLPKAMLPVGAGRFFQSMSALSPDLGFAAHKWVGVSPANAARGVPTVNSLVTVSDVETGRPVAVLDGNRLTVLRTAAISALAAEHLARPDSRSIGFVGAGEQALGHLGPFHELFPSLTEAVCLSGSRRSAERLAAAAQARGIDARVVDHPEPVLACDLVVSTVRNDPGLRPFLDARRLRPGSFAAAVDLGCSWIAAGLDGLDLIATDDRGQAESESTRARLAFKGRFHADLAELVTHPSRGRISAEQRAMFLFPGFALADLAVAAELFRAAQERSEGVALGC